MATCEFRDLCWAEIDDRTLGIDVRDKKASARAKTKHRLPRQVRPPGSACGFEATSLWFCPKYRERKSAAGEEPPAAEASNSGGAVVDMIVPAATEPLSLNAIPNAELNQFVFGHDVMQPELEI